jgi:hypothetical protein
MCLQLHGKIDPSLFSRASVKGKRKDSSALEGDHADICGTKKIVVAYLLGRHVNVGNIMRFAKHRQVRDNVDRGDVAGDDAEPDVGAELPNSVLYITQAICRTARIVPYCVNKQYCKARYV